MNIKTGLRYALWNIKSSITDKRVIAGYILGIFSILKESINFRLYTGNHTINVAECFLVSSRQTGLYLFGAILILSDAPFVNSGSFMMIHRVKRKVWYNSSWIYMFLHMLIYYAVLLGVSIIPFATKAYPENKWSLTTLWMQGGMSEKMAEYNIAPVSKNIFEFTPLNALLIALTLLILYSMIYIALMFSLNLYLGKKMLGTFAAGALVIVTEFIHKEIETPSKWIYKLSLYRNYSFVGGYNPEKIMVSYSLCYLSLIVFLCYMIGEFILPRSEFILEY